MNIKRIWFLIFIGFTIINSTMLLAQPACLGEQGKIKWLLYEDIDGHELNRFIHLPIFPNQPTAYEWVTSIASVANESAIEGESYVEAQYGSYYGSVLRGYILPSETGNYTFNLTADDECRFLLSTDENRVNLVLRSQIDDWTYRRQYEDPEEANQTSTAVTLQAGNYYYFEIWHKERTGGDHAEVRWKTPSNSTDWQEITGNHLYDYACSFDCPPSGTACDDGNANTENDRQDGFCNCVGTPTNISSCIGTQGEIRAMYYLDVEGFGISSLETADKYPLMPDTAEILDMMRGPLQNRDFYGTKIAGFIKTPVSGNYEFMVTCDDFLDFYLSTDDNPDNKVRVSDSNFSHEYEFDDRPEQKSAPIALNKDQFYYFEMIHREGSGGDRYAVFWRTPFFQDTVWRFLDKAYIYGYDCEMACLPEGTPCDDNNNFTKNDQYDDQCNCVGTPCRGSDCDETPVSDVTSTEACGVGEKMDNSAVDSWESCTPSLNPNAARGVSHWIQYDLGQVLLLNESHIWNYNVEGAIGKGFKDVVIDYSTDGNTWTQLGEMQEWTQASGTVGYTGFVGPNFNGVTARYILITALNNWDNGICSGFSKITINATDCLLMGQTCDDGDANSVNDRYDEYCNCIGEGAGLDICGREELIQQNVSLDSREYYASSRIVSEAIISSGKNVRLIAGASITLVNGFEAEAGSDFLAMIGNCTVTSVQDQDLAFGSRATNGGNNPLILAESPEKEATSRKLKLSEDILNVYPNPTNSWTNINFELTNASVASICIFASDGRKITCLAEDNHYEQGMYNKGFPAQQLSQGTYYVVLRTEEAVINKSFVVIE